MGRVYAAVAGASCTGGCDDKETGQMMDTVLSAWNYDQWRMVEQADDMRRARERAWIEKMTQKLRAKRHRREAVAVASPSVGVHAPMKWRPATGPCSDAELERQARKLFSLVFHEMPWPSGWRVVWGELDSPNPLASRLACCYRDARVIVVNPVELRWGSVDDFEETLVHELCHVLHPRGAHGPAFQRTLDLALGYLASLLDAPKPPVALPARRLEHPEPTKGARPRFGGRGGDWERQPWLDPTLEYRG